MKRDLIVEVRCEELPHGMIEPALSALESGLQKLLIDVAHGSSRSFSTPRRLAVVIEGTAASRPSTTQITKGPRLDRAKVDGEWTAAARGFAANKGVGVDDLQVVETERGSIVAAHIPTGGERTEDLISSGLDALIRGLPFRKSMRWGSGQVAWGRPIHHVMAVLGTNLVEAEVAGLATCAETAGHRLSSLGPMQPSSASEYIEGLRERWVIADREERRSQIIAQLKEKAADLGLDVVLDSNLLEEVTDLVEWPVVLSGRFDREFLDLPDRLLIESMRVHQRTFPTTLHGDLQDMFLVVSNSPLGDSAVIAEGNSRVLRARFADARFFLAEDHKSSLAEIGTRLGSMRWIRRLGTVAEKQQRLTTFAPEVGGAVALGHGKTTQRAAELCKVDLASQMVGEFPELQGHMGRLYAREHGESEEVAAAIEEHYLPRFSGDDLPSTDSGIVLALADRLDTLAGCFSVGLQTHSKGDPQGLRRAAHGILAIILERGLRTSLPALLQLAASRFEWTSTQTELLEFFEARLRSLLVESGHPTDVVNAVLAANWADAVSAQKRVEALARWASSEEFGPLLSAFKRVANISRGHVKLDYDQRLFLSPTEQDLLETFERARQEVPDFLSRLEIDQALEAMAGMKLQIDRYLDEVLVNAEDKELRASRLGLLASIARLFGSVADFSKIHAE